jgi:hypothetical protein
MARPMPRPAPVTSALASRRSSIGISFHRSGPGD